MLIDADTCAKLEQIPACARSMALHDAVQLFALGARTGLVCQLTRIDKATANRIYRDIHGRPSPPGQSPFTDQWFLESDRRMLHAGMFWRLHRRFRDSRLRHAAILIEAYEIYRTLTNDPQLDVTYAAFVPKLVDMALWHERQCSDCAVVHVAPRDDLGTICPGCRLYHRHRCRSCGAAIQSSGRGRLRAMCPKCRTRRYR